MIKTARIILLCVFAVALAVPAFAGGVSGLGATCSNVAGTVYKGGVNCLERTEGFVTGCFKNTFNLIEPCLLVTQLATKVAFYPLDRSVGFVESCLCRPVASTKAAQKATPPKAKTPK